MTWTFGLFLYNPTDQFKRMRERGPLQTDSPITRQQYIIIVTTFKKFHLDTFTHFFFFFWSFTFLVTCLGNLMLTYNLKRSSRKFNLSLEIS